MKCRTPSCHNQTEPNKKTGEPKYCPACRRARHDECQQHRRDEIINSRACPQCSEPLKKWERICDNCAIGNKKQQKKDWQRTTAELRFKRTGCQFTKPHGCCPGPRYRVNLSGKERIWCENGLIRAKTKDRRIIAWEKIA